MSWIRLTVTFCVAGDGDKIEGAVEEGGGVAVSVRSRAGDDLFEAGGETGLSELTFQHVPTRPYRVAQLRHIPLAFIAGAR